MTYRSFCLRRCRFTLRKSARLGKRLRHEKESGDKSPQSKSPVHARTSYDPTADGRLYLVDERRGDVVLIDASADGWNEQGRFALDPQSEQRSPKGKIWTHPTIANGRLYLRDQELVFSYDLRERQ